MRADHVFCNNCEKEMFVEVGTDVCPKCKYEGALRWVNDNIQEVDVPSNLVSMLLG